MPSSLVSTVTAHARGRRAWPVVCMLLAMLALPRGFLLDAAAQQPAEEPLILDDEKAKAGPAPAANPPAAADTAGVESLPRRSFLQLLWDGLGWTYFPTFSFISISLVALVITNIWLTRREMLLPAELVSGFEGHLRDRRVPEAYELVRGSDSFLGRVLAAGMARLPSGYPQAIEAMQEVGEEENMKLEHRLSYIALIGTVSPMVGLLGTVDGMVRSFSKIREAINVTPKPSDLAAGIELALITTLVGLCLAIPAVIAHGFLRNVIARRVLEVGIVSEGLMARFSSLGRRPVAGGATAAPATPAATDPA